MQKQLFYSADEAAKILGICTTNVYREIKAGRLKKTSYGRRTLIPLASIEEWAFNLQNQESA